MRCCTDVGEPSFLTLAKFPVATLFVPGILFTPVTQAKQLRREHRGVTESTGHQLQTHKLGAQLGDFVGQGWFARFAQATKMPLTQG